ncbi:MAG: hypothetical protein M0C28_11110 [Candidatus Moduliflexus flocculans]|nr:hypothetical protein [Candidatus Moduliflexus flocculans]
MAPADGSWYRVSGMKGQTRRRHRVDIGHRQGDRSPAGGARRGGRARLPRRAEGRDEARARGADGLFAAFGDAGRHLQPAVERRVRAPLPRATLAARRAGQQRRGEPGAEAEDGRRHRALLRDERARLPPRRARAPRRAEGELSVTHRQRGVDNFAHHLDLDDLHGERRSYSATRAYAQSKACDRLLTRASSPAASRAPASR